MKYLITYFKDELEYIDKVEAISFSHAKIEGNKKHGKCRVEGLCVGSVNYVTGITTAAVHLN